MFWLSQITGGQTTTYTYDGQDQLIGVLTGAGVRSTYTFDGDGMRRTAQEGNVQPTTMVWDGSDYLFLDGPSTDSLVLTLDGEIVASGSKDLLTDPLGTLVREISTGASLSGPFDLYPYGRLVAGSPTPATPFVFVAAAGYYRDGSERIFGFGSELSVVNGRFFQSGNVGGRNDNPWGIPPLPTVGDLLQPPLVGPPGGWPKCGEVRLISSEGTVTNTERTCGTIEVTITKIGGGKIGFTLPPPFNLVIEVGGDVSVGKTWTCHCHVLLHTKKTRTKRCVFECSTPLPNQCGSPEIPIGKWKCEWLPDKISRSRVRRIDCPNGWWEVPYTS